MIDFAEAMGSASTRSSLEVMLDTIRRKDEQPKDLPPALPTRPTSRGRLPSCRRSFPVNFADKNDGYEMNLGSSERREEVKEESDQKSGIFGWVEKSPDLRMPVLESFEEMPEAVDPLEFKCTSSSLAVNLGGQFKSGEAIDYFLKKTKAGPVLVALNPFKNLPLHSNYSVTATCWQKVGESPHVFEVVNQALKEILTGGKNQSIIISGESGSGKTETSKIAMQCFVAIGSGDEIDFEVLKANGKLNEIQLSQAGKISGPKIKTFLLEKSRVFLRAVGERSYHVFYHICEGAPPSLKEKLYLKAAKEYEFLRHSRCLKIDNIDDAHGFHLLMEAFDDVHIAKEDQDNVFSMLAAVLWLAVTNAANLLGCEVNVLALALSTHRSLSGNNIVVQKLTLSQAIDTRDALAKSIYAALFDWVVGQINKSLQVGKTRTGSSIIMLDICGFEFSSKNGFEQFCKNYANERIQQHFISHLLKREQEPQGILSLLDEEPASAKATDFTLLNKLTQQFRGNPCFKGESSSFRICHYAGELAVLEIARACTMQAILCVQKYFRGAEVHCIFNDVKKGVTTLQSFIRAKGVRNEFHFLLRRHRAVVLIQKHARRWVAQKAFAKQQKHIILLQSVIRGWLEREHFSLSRNLEMEKCNQFKLESDQNQKLREQKKSHVEPSDMTELKNRVLKAEAELRDKEEENSSLRQQLQQYEMRWSDYDAKMKSMEEMWQKQMISLQEPPDAATLPIGVTTPGPGQTGVASPGFGVVTPALLQQVQQMSLASAKRSLASNDVASRFGRPDVSPTYPYFESEDTMSVETYTTEGTPAKQSHASAVVLNRTPDGIRNTVVHLVNEFEERRQIFEDDNGFLVELKSGLSISNIDPDAELHKLKVQFASWKKNYKLRLRETQAALKKLRNSGTTKTRRKWFNWRSKCFMYNFSPISEVDEKTVGS